MLNSIEWTRIGSARNLHAFELNVFMLLFEGIRWNSVFLHLLNVCGTCNLAYDKMIELRCFNDKNTLEMHVNSIKLSNSKYDSKDINNMKCMSKYDRTKTDPRMKGINNFPGGV